MDREWIANVSVEGDAELAALVHTFNASTSEGRTKYLAGDQTQRHRTLSGLTFSRKIRFALFARLIVRPTSPDGKDSLPDEKLRAVEEDFHVIANICYRQALLTLPVVYDPDDAWIGLIRDTFPVAASYAYIDVNDIGVKKYRVRLTPPVACLRFYLVGDDVERFAVARIGS